MKKLGKMQKLAIAAFATLALAVPIALAQTASTGQEGQQVNRGEGRGHGKHRGMRGKRGMRGQMFFRGVNLTEDQKAQMKQISQSFRERTQSLHQELRAKRQELRQASEGGTFNEALATQKLQETAGLQARLMAERFQMRQQMLSVLTAEQRTQLEQKRAEAQTRRAQRGGRR